MRLNQNLAALNIYREHTKVIKNQSTALDRISTGYKVNRASDNPNSLAQSERMRIQIRGLQMATRNVQDGMSMLQTAEGGLDTITNMLHRIKELSVQAGGATSDDDKAIIQQEIEQMVKGIDDMANNTEFNGIKLLKDTGVTDNENPNYIFTASGANVNERIPIPKYNLSKEVLGIDNIDITAEGGIDNAISLIDSALSTTLSIRSKYGALENRFDTTFNINSVVGEKIQSAESDLRDADIAEEMMNFAKNGLLMEAGNAMMAQANKFPQDILRILENVK
jgi:flagellin